MKAQALNTSNGFTLIEVIIAMSIFAILAVLSYTGLQSVINSKTGTETELKRLQQVQMTMLTLSTDMYHLSNRDGHDALGSTLARLSAQDNDYIIEFTRNGWRNPTEQARSTLQRVAYQLDEDKLIRIYWPHIDRADDDTRVERTLITNIESLEFRFLDEKNEWQSNWPVASVQASGTPASLPVAVELTLKMNDWGEIKRLIRIGI